MFGFFRWSVCYHNYIYASGCGSTALANPLNLNEHVECHNETVDNISSEFLWFLLFLKITILTVFDVIGIGFSSADDGASVRVERFSL